MSPVEAAAVVLVVVFLLWTERRHRDHRRRRGLDSREDQIRDHLRGAQTSPGTLKRIRHMETARALMAEEEREAAELERERPQAPATGEPGGQEQPARPGTEPSPQPREPAIDTIDDLAELHEPAIRLWCGERDRVYLVGDAAILTDQDATPEGEQPQGRRFQLYTVASTADLETFARPRGWLDGAQAHLPAALALSLRGMLPSLPSIEWQGHELVVRRDRVSSRRRPSPAEWDAFWNRADQLGVWGWRRDYRPEPFATDRLGWGLVLAHGGHLLISGGYGAFPPAGEEDPRLLESLFAALGVKLLPQL